MAKTVVCAIAGLALAGAWISPAVAAHTTLFDRSRQPSMCNPTDQDKYVYHPHRLAVKAACIRITGQVEAVREEADGDFHILVALDQQYRHLLRRSNRGEELGDLVVEPVCVRPVSQRDAIRICKSDPDPLRPPFPKVGMRVWMEGRYVLDLQHGGWAELHPLYRWGHN